MLTAKEQTLNFKPLCISPVFMQSLSTSSALVILLAWLFLCPASVTSGYTRLLKVSSEKTVNNTWQN